jgi:hypothetical protein
MFGETVPFAQSELRALYPDRASYVTARDACVNQLVTDGLLLASDVAIVRERGRSLADHLFPATVIEYPVLSVDRKGSRGNH